MFGGLSLITHSDRGGDCVGALPLKTCQLWFSAGILSLENPRKRSQLKNWERYVMPCVREKFPE